jgi:hypothetical protein
MIRPKSHRWKNSENARNSDPTSRGKIAEGAKGSCHNSQEEDDGQRAGRCLETTKALSPAPTKKIAEAAKVQAEAEARPSVPIETKAVAPEDKADLETSDTGMEAGQDMAEKAKSPAPEALVEVIDYIVRHASGKKLSKEILEARHYAQKLKYSKGALVFNGTNEDDFLYCLPDNKEISVCREIAKSMGFPKLEEGLSAMSKDDLADSLPYNSIKV